MEETHINTYRGFDIYEHERYDSDDYDELLDESYAPILIGNLEYLPSQVLAKVDPIAYACGIDDMQEYYFTIDNTEFEGEEYETETDAEIAIDNLLEDEEEEED